MAELSKREEKIKQLKEGKQNLIVILEDIHDPHNAAAVWRSSDAFGVKKVCLIFDKEIRFNPKRVGKTSSSSANKWIDFEIFKSIEECIKKIKNEGYKIYATVLDKEAESLTDVKFNKKTALMFGNEHRGLSKMAIKLADKKIYIPMRGMVQSLNLSVTAGICLYEYTRQNHLLARPRWE
jgi:tRNA (guanosine-2'-O-)-methyltransferase